jgi:archaeal flagellar protein FlaI
MREIIDKYKIEADGVIGEVVIYLDENENVPIYDLRFSELEKGTAVLMEQLREDMAKDIPISIEEITDPRKLKNLKDKFYQSALEKIKEKLPDLEVKDRKVLAGILLHDMYGLGWVEVLLGDDFLEEIAINNSNTPIAVYHKKHAWLKTNKKLDSEMAIYNFASQIGRKVNREITTLNPMMDAHLLAGDRVAATLFPISTFGNTITIRKFARSPWTIISLINNGTTTKEIVAFMWLCIQYEMNLMIVGGTASGKTSFMNAVAALSPPSQRIISIEDTREISLPEPLHWNWIPLTSRGKNPEGMGEVTMLDLMIASLRMRPDKIIVGEVRRREQAETMFEAMHTGHSVITTIHADTVEQVIRRILEPPFSIPRTEVEALQLIVVQFRDRRKNIRRTLEIAEVSRGSSNTDLETNTLFRWRPREDKMESIADSIRIVEDLNLHTGMTMSEIKKDLADKEKILQWMIDRDLGDMESIGKLMKIYYKNPQKVLDLAEKNLDFEK